MKNIPDLLMRLNFLVPSAKCAFLEQDYDSIEWLDKRPLPEANELTSSAVDAGLVRVKRDEAMRVLRQERSHRLEESDWWASSDLTMSAKRKSYRQALRALPANTSPSLDDSGQLTGVTWPTKPK